MSRLDKELVKRCFIDSRTKATELIENGKVEVNNKVVLKPSYEIKDTDIIKVLDNDMFRYVSRGGLKLEKALKVFNFSVKDKVVMDIGSSTGGFTDCCLQNGAKKVVAVDVGTDIMHKSFKNNKRIDLHENLNILNAPDSLFDDVELIVSDVSFISITKIIEKIYNTNKKLDLIILIKPQFECGKEIAKKYKGIILNKKIHSEIINNVIKVFNCYQYNIQGLDFSPIKGGDGNIEYLAYFTNKIAQNQIVKINNVIEMAFNS